MPASSTAMMKGLIMDRKTALMPSTSSSSTDLLTVEACMRGSFRRGTGAW